MTDAPAGILALWLDMAPGTESELNEWFNREHHAERVDIPGFVSARRYVALRGTSEYFIFYRTQDLAVLTSPAYLARLNEPTPWTSATMPHFRNTSRSACRPLARLGRGEGGVVATLRFGTAEESEARLEGWLREAALPAALERPGIVSAELWRGDPGSSNVDTEERRIRGGPDAVADWVVILSGNHPEQIEAVTAACLDDAAIMANGGTRPEVGVYRLLFALQG
jgi:hypothetical protein